MTWNVGREAAMLFIVGVVDARPTASRRVPGPTAAAGHLLLSLPTAGWRAVAARTCQCDAGVGRRAGEMALVIVDSSCSCCSSRFSSCEYNYSM